MPISIERFKTEKRHEGVLWCEVCSWMPPQSLTDLARSGVLHAHHVIPRTCGGKDERDNLILLCANCHGLTHHLWGKGKARAGWALSEWQGPNSRSELIARLRLVIRPDFGPAVVPQLEIA